MNSNKSLIKYPYLIHTIKPKIFKINWVLLFIMFIEKTAIVSKDVKIGRNTKVWHLAQIREHAEIGDNCIIGKNCYIDHHVKIGNNVKIQNNSSIYYMALIEDRAFIGPHAVITNDKSPRAIDKKGNLKTEKEWKAEKTTIKEGASIGAGSILLPGITIGRYSMTGAGSIVTKDVRDYTLVYGNPAKFMGYVCKCGKKIVKVEEKSGKIILKCPACKEIIITK